MNTNIRAYPPTGMLCMDRDSEFDPAAASPIVKIGNSTDGQKITGNLDEWGIPTLDVIVGNGKCRANIKAKIDTGTYNNHINSKVAKQMALNPIGSITQRTPYGKQEVSVYLLIFGLEAFPDTQFAGNMSAVNFDDVDMLIGTHFLTEFCNLHIYGKERKFELVFR
jgi:hypothetical protein